MSRNVLATNEVSNVVEKLLKSNDFDDIKKSFEFLLKHIPLSSHTETGIALWRARKIDKGNGVGFPLITDMIYPPDELAKAGRLNKANESVLYASASNHGALAEVCCEVGDRVQVAAFVLREKNSLLCGYVGEITKVFNGNSNAYEALEPAIAHLDEEQRTSIQLLDSYFSSILSDANAKDKGYCHSAILAEAIRAARKNMDTLDAIVYPGVESNGAINYAIEKHALNKFNIPDMHVLEITKKYRFGFYEWNHIAKVKDYDGNKIIWESWD